MPRYTPWTWSQPHGRHYSYLLADDGQTILQTLWSGPAPQTGAADTVAASRADSIGTSPMTQTSTRLLHKSSDPGTDEIGGKKKDGEEEQEDQNDSGDDDKPTKEGHQRFDSGTSSMTRVFGSMNIGSYASSASNFSSKSPQRAPLSYISYGSISPPTPQPKAGRATIACLPADVQANIGYLDRRFIQTGPDQDNAEQLDPRFRRVARNHHAYFFVTGRVFKMLWTEPAGQANPGKTRNSTHFSTVWFGEQAYSEIRRFVVVRNKGTFSQCVPIQTYKGRGATKPGLIMHDHGVIHTSTPPPNLIQGEYLSKYSLQVMPTANESLEPSSRVNYGKAYAVEHNVKVLDIGMVMEGHRYLLLAYFDSAMRGE